MQLVTVQFYSRTIFSFIFLYFLSFYESRTYYLKAEQSWTILGIFVREGKLFAEPILPPFAFDSTSTLNPCFREMTSCKISVLYFGQLPFPERELSREKFQCLSKLR